MERLQVSSDGRRLVTEQGTPFCYLADTAWTLPQRLKWDDALYYLNRRKMQGFTAVQVVALDPERDQLMRDPAGNPALLDGDVSRPNPAYFDYLDKLLDATEQLGLYVLLLPAWGQLVVGEDWGGRTFPRTITADNAYGYGRWLGERYADRPNLLWCLGGDRQPIHRGADYRDVWRRMAEGIGRGVTGIDCSAQEPSPAWEQVLITYHTCFERETGEYSTMSYWSDEEAWLRLILLQSGHGLETASYRVVQREHERERTLPVLDAEPAYERMPMNWPELYPLHDDWIVRKRAYWSLLAGAAGHTYGHASVWCMIAEKERDEVLSQSWFEALESPGAAQMTVLRTLVESVPPDRWIPAQELLGHVRRCPEGCLDDHRQAVRDSEAEFVLVYLSSGGTEQVDLSSLGAGSIVAAWFDPRTGAVTDGPTIMRGHGGPVSVTTPTQGRGCDWVLVAARSDRWAQQLRLKRTWAEPMEQDRLSMIWN